MTEVCGVHPHAETFPLFTNDELARLAEDIAANGLRDPITLTPDGLIIDGRNRYAACQQAGVEPRFVPTDDDPGTVVRSRNATRRHMTTGQLAMSTAMSLALDGKRVNGRWARDSTAITGSGNSHPQWSQRMTEAGAILDHAPDLAVPVRDGALALDAAYQQAVDRRDAERNKLAEAERLAAEEHDAQVFMESHDPAMAAQVGDSLRFDTFVVAQFAWQQLNREEAQRIAKAKAAEAKAAADEKLAMTDLYSQIARGLQTVGGYGGHSDIDNLMAKYSVKYLDPPQYERAYSAENLQNARRFIDNLIEWQESRDV